MASIAAKTRRAIDQRPSLRHALRAGVLNYTAAARLLEIDGDTGAVASALRRYASELPPLGSRDHSIRVRMERDVSPEALTLFDTHPGDENLTAITLEGTLDPTVFARVLSSISAGDVTVKGAGQLEDQGVVLVADADASRALRLVEAAID